MSTDPVPHPPETGHWLDLGLHDQAPAVVGRIRLFRQLMATAAVFRGRIDQLYAASGVTSQQAALLQLIEAQPQPPTTPQHARLSSARMSDTPHPGIEQLLAQLRTEATAARCTTARQPAMQRCSSAASATSPRTNVIRWPERPTRDSRLPA